MIGIKVNTWLVRTYMNSFGVGLCLKLTVIYTLLAKDACNCRNYLKMSGFPSRIIRYSRYKDTDLSQLCYETEYEEWLLTLLISISLLRSRLRLQ